MRSRDEPLGRGAAEEKRGRGGATERQTEREKEGGKKGEREGGGTDRGRGRKEVALVTTKGDGSAGPSGLGTGPTLRQLLKRELPLPLMGELTPVA